MGVARYGRSAKASAERLGARGGARPSRYTDLETASGDPLDAVLRGERVPWSAFGTTAERLLDDCAAQEISTLVYHRLLQLPAAGDCDWPDEIRCELARVAHAAAATELVRGREIASVLGALASAGVCPILLKGVPLAYAVYESPGSRPHADTDLIVGRDQIDVVKQTMGARGYAEPPLSEGELIFCQFALMRHDLFGVDHAFDVHWKISTQSLFADVLTYDELAADAVPVPALGSHARAAGPVHALLLACLHPVMHHRNVDRPIWLYDIHLLVSRLSERELERFAELAVVKRMAAICAHQLRRTCARFGTRVPDRVLARLASGLDDEPSTIYLQPARRWRHELASNVRGLGRWTDRLRLLREVLVPSARYMKQRYRLNGVMLLPAVYVYRCVYGAWKVVRGNK
jgi:hypothetical protein